MLTKFDEVPKAPDTQVILDTALGRGRKAAGAVGKIPDRALLQCVREKERISTITESIGGALAHVHDGFPSFDRMSAFTVQLLSFDIDVGKTREALGAIAGISQTLTALAKEHKARLTVRIPAETITRAFLGRASSVLRHAQPHLNTLNRARDALRALPMIDDSLFTVAIAGFPNVGKSTLLRHLTGAKARVQPYAFTTKGLNVGYIEYKYNKIQCIDTPGTLNREKMNTIERKADVTLTYLAQVVVYVMDPTEASAPIEDQKKLYKKVKELDKDVLVYMSKTDIAPPGDVETLAAKHPDAFTDPEELKKDIVKKFRKWA
jgi:nucleolar GTP-binding protein